MAGKPSDIITKVSQMGGGVGGIGSLMFSMFDW